MSEPAETYVPSRIPSAHPLHEPWQLTATERERYRTIAKRSRLRAAQAAIGELDALYGVNVPVLDPEALMPRTPLHGLRALSLFSGGGGLDIGFERAGYQHVGSYELMADAGTTLLRNRPNWFVRSGPQDGDVDGVDWRPWRGEVDVLHGGPPCQPFSHAGRQRGALDPRDCWPMTVQAIKAVQPEAFVCENVPALGSTKFADYVKDVIVGPLERARPRYYVKQFLLRAWDLGVPQVRRRVIFVGFRSKAAADRFEEPTPTHYWGDPVAGCTPTLGVRAALGLPEDDQHEDALAPTIRSGLTGPRFTTSVLNSTSANRTWASLGIWPNGVAVDREAAARFPTEAGAFRLSVPDVALIQGFPDDWTWPVAVYKAVGQIGNAVPPPLGYAIGAAVGRALLD